MTTPEVQTVHPAAERLKLGGAALVVLAGFVSYFLLSRQDAWVRWLALLALVAVAVGIFLLSDAGRRLTAFGKDAWRELQKVVWPTRKESMQMTGYVFVFVVLMAIFLWGVDKLLEWVFYGLLLGWK